MAEKIANTSQNQQIKVTAIARILVLKTPMLSSAEIEMEAVRLVEDTIVRAKVLAEVAGSLSLGGELKKSLALAQIIEFPRDRMTPLFMIVLKSIREGEKERARVALKELLKTSDEISSPFFRNLDFSSVASGFASIGDFDDAIKIAHRIDGDGYNAKDSTFFKIALKLATEKDPEATDEWSPRRMKKTFTPHEFNLAKRIAEMIEDE